MLVLYTSFNSWWSVNFIWHNICTSSIHQLGYRHICASIYPSFFHSVFVSLIFLVESTFVYFHRQFESFYPNISLKIICFSPNIPLSRQQLDYGMDATSSEEIVLRRYTQAHRCIIRTQCVCFECLMWEWTSLDNGQHRWLKGIGTILMSPIFW